jgi:hypothetical protein
VIFQLVKPLTERKSNNPSLTPTVFSYFKLKKKTISDLSHVRKNVTNIDAHRGGGVR